MSAERTRQTFRRRHRLRLAREYSAVYAARLKTIHPPLIVHARVGDGAEPRLGLAIGRRLGIAVKRTAVKRRLREAFRLLKHQIPVAPGGGQYDLVISAQPHDVLSTPEYMKLLQRAIADLHRHATRRHERQQRHEPG